MTQTIQETLTRFAKARLEALRIMKDAADIEGLPAHYKAQAEAIHGLCAIKLARITGHPDAEDFLALRDDIEAVAAKIDPLFLAIGRHAKENSHVVDLKLFENVAAAAIDGNAGYELTAASEAADAETLEAAE